MTATAILLALAVLSAAISAVALVRLATPFERLHAGSFIAIAGGVAIAAAAFVSDGVTDRALKTTAIVLVLAVSGSLANYATARALHYRGGERR